MKKIIILFGLFAFMACHDNLDIPQENTTLRDEVDYTNADDMILPLIGSYESFQSRGWEQFPLISVRGDDVNPGGLGDQQPFADTDKYTYNKDYWMYNSLWQTMYNDIFAGRASISELTRFVENGNSQQVADQYKAEIRTTNAFLLFQVSRVFGDIFIPNVADPSAFLNADTNTKDEVMQYISDEMDASIPLLLDMRPNERTDIPGGVTKYTALAMKALANLELENYQAVADATGQIINSGKFQLMSDYYNLFKIPGKLSNENLLEFQYSDFGTSSGDAEYYLHAFFGPQGAAYVPKVAGANGGWGFYEPSLKWIKFMLDRGERTRLETSVLFTNRGIDEIKSDPNYSTIPDWISNVTPSGDRVNDYPRAMFASGKHYLPSDQLTPGRTRYGENKNFICLRYSEVLLMYAEALTQGASGTAGSAADAMNVVRSRAGLAPVSNPTLDDVMDEKFAELAMEWGTRYYDMVRLGRMNELSYEGRTFSMDQTFLPYPQNQVDILPGLRD